MASDFARRKIVILQKCFSVVRFSPPIFWIMNCVGVMWLYKLWAKAPMCVIFSAEKMAPGGGESFQDGGFQHVVGAGTGIKGPDGSLLDPIWRIVAAILTSVSCLKNFGFPWSMSPGITSCVDFCRGGSGPSCVTYFMNYVFF